MLAKAKQSRILAIDFGMARLGLALSDERHIIASRLATFPASKKLEKTAEELAAFLQKHQNEQSYTLETIVIGMPLMLSGKNSVLSNEVTLFAKLLGEKLSIPIVTWDERLTTVQAERSLKEGGHLSRKQRARIVDEVSAVLLLQSFLDWRMLQHEREECKDM